MSVIKRNKVALRNQLNNNFELILFEGWESAKGAPLLVGFADIGITPIITTNSLIEQLQLPQIGFLKCLEQAPSATIRGGQPAHSIRVYGNEHIVIIMSDSKVKEDSLASALVGAVIKCVAILGSKMIYSTEGVPVESTEKIERKEMQFLTTDEEISKKLTEIGHKPLTDAVIAGISGGLLAECSLIDVDHDINYCILLAPTCSLYPDVWSSVLIIQALNSLLTTTTDTSKLESSARKLEAKANEILNKKSTVGDLYI